MYNDVRGGKMATHLMVRSHYSLLKGMMPVELICEKAKHNESKSIALTDRHVLFGALDFYDAARKHHIKPIYGMEITILEDESYYDSLVLARTNEGYQGLIHLSYLLSKQAYISEADVVPFESELIFIAYSEQGPFEKGMLSKNLDEVANTMERLKKMFSYFYIGLSHQESGFFSNVNDQLRQMAVLREIECVALPKVYYENKDDEEAFRALQAIDKSTYLEDKTLVSSPNRNFISDDDFKVLYTEAELSLTDTIAEMCNVSIMNLKTELPEFETHQEVSNKVFLEQLSHFGLKRRLNNSVPEKYRERLNYELKIINKMNFTDYFLIVYDVIRYAKKAGIYVGPGRGSSAGSLVAYCLGIVEIDPIEYDLLFERFLNPERVSMPDIDIDFPDDKRQYVIDYVRNKYGDDYVAHIVTFGTLKARQAFRDTARVLQVPIRKVDQVSKLIDPMMGLRDNYNKNSRFKSLIQSEDLLKKTFELACKIEGMPRHTSTHAAGIVLSKKPLDVVVPVIQLDSETKAVQYEMSHLESIGLVKIDFLGLRNLTIIDNISRQINESEAFDIMSIPLDDQKTYELISRAETVGVFQLESDGMKALLKKVKPNKFSDIVDTVALFRPGPMENIPLYLENRDHPEKVKYIHDDLKRITESTNGILIYQEQIMQVAQIMAGFSLARADILRKAMGKKNAKELDGLKTEFIQGCIDKGHEETFSEELFSLIYKFANYGFNKSHSVAYGLIAYQLSYLKANYPHLFYTYLLTSVIGSEVKTRQYIDECRRRKVDLRPVNLEQSRNSYTLEGYAIRLPFTVIKGISKSIGTKIQNEVHDNGPYLNYYNAISRLNLVGIKKNQFELLIQAGAFDYLNSDRLSMIASLEEALRYANIIRVEKDGQSSLNMDLISEPIFTVVSENRRQVLNDELVVLGFYFSEHPTLRLKQKHESDSLIEVKVRDKFFRIIAMVDRIKLHRTKKGDQMAFIQLSDDTGLIDGVVFPSVYDKIKVNLEIGVLVLVKGQMREPGSLIIMDMYRFDSKPEFHES